MKILDETLGMCVYKHPTSAYSNKNAHACIIYCLLGAHVVPGTCMCKVNPVHTVPIRMHTHVSLRLTPMGVSMCDVCAHKPEVKQ